MVVKSSLFISINYLITYCSLYSFTEIDIDPILKNVSIGTRLYSPPNKVMTHRCPTNPWHEILTMKSLESFNTEDWQKYNAVIPYLPPLYVHKVNLTDKTVFILGKHKLEEDLLQNFAEALEEDSPDVLSDKQKIERLGNIFCGFSPFHMAQLDTDILHSLLNDKFFQSMRGCKSEKVRVLLEKLQTNGILGPPKTWKVETVERLGILASALSPEDFKRIRPQSMSGMSAEVIRNVDPETLKELFTDQLRNLPRKSLLEWRRATKDSRPLYANSTKSYFNLKLIIFSGLISNMFK